MSIFEISHGSKKQFFVPVPALAASLPVTVVKGFKDGPNVLITAGIHNQEYVGIETSNRLALELAPDRIQGCVTIVHVCNLTGFFALSPDVVPEDGRNLNRVFPGGEAGSASQRLASFIIDSFMTDASCLIDLHCGGYREELLPHVYYQGMGDKYLENASKQIAKLVDVEYMVRADSYSGSMFSFAAKLGIPGVIIERGGMAGWSENEVRAYLADIRRILQRLNVLEYSEPQRAKPLSISRVDHYNAGADGCWYPAAAIGVTIKKGEALGSIRDFFGNELASPIAEADCVILYQLGSLAVRSGEFLLACGAIQLNKLNGAENHED